MKWFKWLEVLLRCCSDAVHLWLCHSAQSWETLAWQAVASSQAKWELRADHGCLYEWLWKSMWTDQLHRVQLQICPNLLSIFSIYFCFPDHRIGQNMEGLPIEFRVPCWIHGCGQKFFSVYQDEPDKNLTSRLSGFRCFAILGPLWNSTESGLSFRRTRRQSRCAVVDLQIPICQWLIMLYSQLYTFMCVCDNII
jgi:hypothetical protein